MYSMTFKIGTLRLSLTDLFTNCSVTRWSVVQTVLGFCMPIFVPLLRTLSSVSVSMPEKKA